MLLEIDGGTCTSTCQVTDRFVSRVTVSPGARTSRVNATNIYSPNAGNFGNKHFELWAINRGSIVGKSNTGNLPGNSIDYISSSRNLNNDVLTTAVTLWVYQNPVGSYIADGAKTHDATCRPPGNNTCYY